MQYYTSGSFALSAAVSGKKTCFGITGQVKGKARAWFNKIG
jgi:hypothetical protein